MLIKSSMVYSNPSQERTNRDARHSLPSSKLPVASSALHLITCANLKQIEITDNNLYQIKNNQ